MLAVVKASVFQGKERREEETERRESDCMEERGRREYAREIREEDRKRRDEGREAEKTRREDERHQNDKFMKILMVMVVQNGNGNMHP